MPNKDYQGVMAQKMQKMKKKLKFKKKHGQRKAGEKGQGAEKGNPSPGGAFKGKKKEKHEKGSKTFARNRLAKKMKKH